MSVKTGLRAQTVIDVKLAAMATQLRAWAVKGAIATSMEMLN